MCLRRLVKSFMRCIAFRIQEENADLYKPSLESLRSQIRASTSSMTSVPKPLKFLRPHYDDLKSLHEKWSDGPNKVNHTVVALFIVVFFTIVVKPREFGVAVHCYAVTMHEYVQYSIVCQK